LIGLALTEAAGGGHPAVARISGGGDRLPLIAAVSD
jgi:hypothetical protein